MRKTKGSPDLESKKQYEELLEELLLGTNKFVPVVKGFVGEFFLAIAGFNELPFLFNLSKV